MSDVEYNLPVESLTHVPEATILDDSIGKLPLCCFLLDEVPDRWFSGDHLSKDRGVLAIIVSHLVSITGQIDIITFHSRSA